MKKVIYFGIFAILVGFGTRLYFVKKSNKNKNSIPLFADTNKNGDEKVLAFHPDSVLKIHLQNGEAKFDFERKTNHNEWEPQDLGSSQDLLNELSVYGGTTMKELGSSTNALGVTFNDGQKWVGQWDDENFVWSEGPYQGRGVKIPEVSALRKGRFFNQGKSIQLCPSRLKSLKITDSKGDTSWFIYQEKLNWKLKKTVHKKITTLPVDPNFVEMWLGQHCDLELQQVQDASLMAQSGHTTDTVELIFEKSKQTIEGFEFGQKKQVLYKLNDMLILSKELNDALVMLKSSPYGVRASD